MAGWKDPTESCVGVPVPCERYLSMTKEVIGGAGQEVFKSAERFQARFIDVVDGEFDQIARHDVDGHGIQHLTQGDKGFIVGFNGNAGRGRAGVNNVFILEFQVEHIGAPIIARRPNSSVIMGL